MLIKINSNWDFFYFEEDIIVESPVDSYYFQHNDLSINILLKLKWSIFGFYFLNSILETLNDDSYTKDICFSHSIDLDFYIKKQPKLLLIDDTVIENFTVFKHRFETEYVKDYFTNNSTVSFKLKVNAKEFIMLQNVLIPKLGYFE